LTAVSPSTPDPAPAPEDLDPVPPLVRTIIEILRGSSIITAALAPVARRFGLSLAGFNVLHTLVHARGALRPSAITREQVIPAQTLTSVLDGLERQGLVERVPDPADRRVLLARVTAQGSALYEECCQSLLAVESELLSGFSEPDMEHLRRLLGRIGKA
jgi:DNA-binding MarR family transcriptional regulator